VQKKRRLHIPRRETESKLLRREKYQGMAVAYVVNPDIKKARLLLDERYPSLFGRNIIVTFYFALQIW
jgi:hypothetical protein